MREVFKRLSGVLEKMSDYRTAEERLIDQAREFDFEDLKEDAENIIPWLDGEKPFYFRLDFYAEVIPLIGARGRIIVTDGLSVHEFW